MVDDLHLNLSIYLPICLMMCKTFFFFLQEVELAERTVRAADNNAKLHVALQAKAKQAERMMVANQGLTLENSTLRNDVDLAKVSEVGRRAFSSMAISRIFLDNSTHTHTPVLSRDDSSKVPAMTSIYYSGKTRLYSRIAFFLLEK